MCFSVQVDKDIRKLAEQFRAVPIVEEFHKLKKLQDFEAEVGPHEIKKLLGLKRAPQASQFKTPEDDGRIYPNTFAPVIQMHKGQRIIRPMRYRVRPAGSSEEIPSKYNVFNARIDSLEKRKTWSTIFMRNHGLFPFKSFYEWVEDENGQKRLINFKPDNAETMWAPCLWDEWSSSDGSVKFSSFALLTDAPPPEVEEKGHDRCPIFLKEENIDRWLEPKSTDKKGIYDLLGHRQQTYYLSEFHSDF